ncbi:DNA polymerase lambda, partial [Neolecta irregularis DAH-3]
IQSSWNESNIVNQTSDDNRKQSGQVRIDISTIEEPIGRISEASSDQDFEQCIAITKKSFVRTGGNELSTVSSPEGSDPASTDQVTCKLQLPSPPKRQRKTKSNTENWEADFQCMHEHTGHNLEENPNSYTIGILEQLRDHYKRTQDQWRTKSYREAIAVLRNQKEYIKTAEEASKLKGIGPGISKKIEEIVQTGHLEKLDSLGTSDKVLEMFLGVYRCGPKTAEKWIQAGCRSLEDVKLWGNPSPAQLIGIELYEDLHTRISRDEVTEQYEMVKNSAQRIDPGLIVYPMGSYRRGATECGDIDIVITKENAEMPELAASLPKILQDLHQKQVIIRGPAEVGGGVDNSKWQGISKLPKPGALHRRMDILLIPWNERGAAFIYFV